MALSDTSIKNPVFAWMVLLGIVVFGLVAFFRLGVSQLPDVDFPVLTITTTWQNAAPEVMETVVTDAIEDSIMGVEGIQEVTSTTLEGQSQITIQFDLNRDIDVSLQEVQSCIARAQKILPSDMDPPIITKSNPEDSPIIWLTVSGNKPMRYLIDYTRDYIKDQISMVQGVGEITLGGYTEPNLRVWLNSDKMKKDELTVEDISAAILSQHAELPAGYIDSGASETNVRVVGEATTPKEFGQIIIPSRVGSLLWKKFHISDVATVEDNLANVRQISRVMGEDAVSIGVRKQRNTNAVEVAHNIKKKIALLQKSLPEGVHIGVRFDASTFVEDSMKDMYFVMILSIILTSLVCWLFLGSVGSAVNVFLTIPMSICGTLFIIYILGFTLNAFTLLGLSLVIGIVVDDAIMMLENIARHREEGETRIRAAIKGAREITFAAIAASVAILAIFIPVIFMQGVIGKYFLQFGVTISVAVMISLLGALTLTPMYCSQYLSVGHSSGIGKLMDTFMDWLRVKYYSVLTVCLNHRWKVIAGSFIIFIVSLMFFGMVKKEFVPPQDMARLMLKLETKIGSSLDFTRSVYSAAGKVLKSHPEVDTYFYNAGGSQVNTGMMMINLKPKNERPKDKNKGRPLTQQELMPILRKELKAIPGATKVVLQDPSLMGFTAKRGFPVEFTITGMDWDKLADLSKEMWKEMEKSGLMVDIDSDYNVGMPEVRIVPDRQKAAGRGVSVTSIGNTINGLVGGIRVGKYTHNARRYDIRVQMLTNNMDSVADLSKIWVRNDRGEIIKLPDVVNLVQKPSILSVTRENRERAIRMFANPAPGKSQGEALSAVEKIGKKILPEGYRIAFSGSAQTYKDSFSSLFIALILGIFVAYMVLGTQFNSFIHPFTVLIALPFSVSGAGIALFLTHQTLNIYSAIGIILLMGIVKKNSILLVDFTNQKREEGMDVAEALKTACPLRLRPILMTSVATIAAAVPPALALGPGAETRVPMAMVIIGGVTLSTLLTLFVVPCFYSVMTKLENRSHVKDVHDAMEELSKV
jgi:HAE1 family hydrophobic/amphiphilic exporter-1